MTVQEFSDNFDTLVNSFGEGASVSFDEYEKSVFLTKAQKEMVILLYNGKSAADAFESSEENRRNLETLITQKEVTDIEKSSSSVISGYSYIVPLEDNIIAIIFESVDWNIDSCLPKTNVQVQPATHDEYHKIKNNPFRGANNHRVLRIDKGDNSVELISKYPIGTYRYRYLRLPKPIILENLPDGLTIDGESTSQTSELNEALHSKILEYAVKLGLQSKGIGINNNQ